MRLWPIRRRMAHGDDVRISAYHPNGVLQAFPFGNRGIGRIVEADNPAAKPQHGSLKGHLRTGGGFVKQGGQNPPSANAVIIVHMLPDIAGSRVISFPIPLPTGRPGRSGYARDCMGCTSVSSVSKQVKGSSSGGGILPVRHLTVYQLFRLLQPFHAEIWGKRGPCPRACDTTCLFGA